LEFTTRKIIRLESPLIVVFVLAWPRDCSAAVELLAYCNQ